jgi:hypothetical protein
MKEFFLVVMAGIGAYAVYQWYQKTNTSNAGQVARNQNPGQTAAAITAAAVGVSGPLVSGVPAFRGPAIANGHGDQIAAAYHNNALATIPGGVNYQPAFGPNENR